MAVAPYQPATFKPVFLGSISSIEKNHEQVETAKAGDEVCVKIENTTGDAPKLYGRHFTYTDALVSKVGSTPLKMLSSFNDHLPVDSDQSRVDRCLQDALP